VIRYEPSALCTLIVPVGRGFEVSPSITAATLQKGNPNTAISAMLGV
jgi:hypothetical protein